MACRICGNENATYIPMIRHTACRQCAAGTPKKVGYSEFVETYFHGEEPVSQRTAREFYDDYICSKDTLEQYIIATTSTEDDDGYTL